MWNALAGYGGLVSIGQQAFFGLGAYFAVRLADCRRRAVYPALVLAALLRRRSSRCRFPRSCCGCAAASSRSACGWSPSSRICSSISIRWCSGETGTSLIALNAYPAATRRALTYWMALGGHGRRCSACCSRCCASPLGAAIQAIRDNEEAAAVGRRAGHARPSASSSCSPPSASALAGALWLATTITFQPKTYFSVQWTAYMIFMVLVGGLGTFEGADPRRRAVLCDRSVVRRDRRLVPGWPRRGGAAVRAVSAARACGAGRTALRPASAAGRPLADH